MCFHMYTQWEIKLQLHKIITYDRRKHRTDRHRSQEQGICKMNLNILPFQRARKLSKIIGTHILEHDCIEFMNHLEVVPAVQR